MNHVTSPCAPVSPAGWLLRVATVVLAGWRSIGCQTPGSADVDPSVCTDQVSLAMQDIARVTDASQSYSAQDRVLTAVSAEDNLRGCGGAMADITAARTATCHYLPMTVPGQYPPAVGSDLRRRCCPSAGAALQAWCAGYDAGM